MGFLSKRALIGLQEYVYKPGGYTWMDDLHQPFWNWLVNKMPMWLAPNLITLSGLCWLIVAYFLTAIYLPNFEGEAPRWLYFFNGIAVLVYLHLDCIDGKQARRTKSSSPLGQLFDHGCDALSLHLIIATVAASLNVGYSWKTVLTSSFIMVPWMLAHWEEYHTGVMLYGNGYWGVLEANYALVSLHWITAALGPEFWRYPISRLLSSPQLTKFTLPFLGQHPLGYYLEQAQVNDVLMLALGITAVIQFLTVVNSTLVKKRDKLPANEAGHKQLGLGAALWHLVQMVALFAVGITMMLQPMSAPGQARAVMGTFGIAYALQASVLIMSHVAKEPFTMFIWPLLVMALQVANQRALLLDPALVAWAANALTVALYLHYVFSVVNEICVYLGIPCLTIKRAVD